VECARQRVKWSGAPGCSQLLHSVEFAAERRKPLQPECAAMKAFALR